MKYLSFILILFAFLLSCEVLPEDPNKVNSIPLSIDESVVLIFNKEKKIELWSSEKPSQLINTLENINLSTFKIGTYEAGDHSYSLIFNEISSITHASHSKIIVFPNDPRTVGFFNPCFACPFDNTSLYAKLELIIKDYSLELIEK